MSLQDVLQRERKVLLDLSNRNRLINMPTKPSARSIVVHDELALEVYKGLVEKKKTFSFLAAGGDLTPTHQDLTDDELSEGFDECHLAVPADGDQMGSGTLAARHTDTKLQTALKSEALQSRLLKIYYEARTLLEEQGVNVLYIALGKLRYRESQDSQIDRFAPLVLVPVQLQRKSARDQFVLSWTGDDVAENLSLVEKARSELGVEFPSFASDEDLDLDLYFTNVQEAVSSLPEWSVLRDEITLGFFSFAKLLMFRDLDPENWPEGCGLADHPIIQGLMGQGFDEPSGLISESCNVDTLVGVEQLKHVLDCDSTQAIAIEEVRRGTDLVIQGPPGTGKSQTITNLIASTVADGKTVLFVSEKMAALEVVQRRLRALDLGPVCLELHSNKANKKAVLSELEDALTLTRPSSPVSGRVVPELEEVRRSLNIHANKLHEPFGAAGFTTYTVLGELSNCVDLGKPCQLDIQIVLQWSTADIARKEQLLASVAAQLEQLGNPREHPWRGVNLDMMMLPDAEALVDALASAGDVVATTVSTSSALAEKLGVSTPFSLREARDLLSLANRIHEAPPLDRGALSSAVWDAGLDSLAKTIAAGSTWTALRAEWDDRVIDQAWQLDWQPQRLSVAAHGTSMLRIFNGTYRGALRELRSVCKAQLPKSHLDRIKLLDALIAGKQASATLVVGEVLAKKALGNVWKGEHTDWDLAASIVSWVTQQSTGTVGSPSIRDVAANTERDAEFSDVLLRARSSLDATSATIKDAVVATGLDPEEAFGSADLSLIGLDRLVEHLNSWRGNAQGLLSWLAYRFDRGRAIEEEIGTVLSTHVESARPAEQLVRFFRFSLFKTLLHAASNVYPELPRFDGEKHSSLVKRFRELDKQRLDYARYEALSAHYAQLPKGGGLGALGVLKGEIARRRGHMPIRKLLGKAGNAIQKLKPVFMMSPLSVAQYLEPGKLQFDLLLVDEASQVEPIDALGAIARSRQVVVVGDSEQLPPTSFFSKVTGDNEADAEGAEDAVASAKDLESILTMCVAKGLPEKMLRWHYRSKHESLIAVSNTEFYRGRLHIVPSPVRDSAHLGLRLTYLQDGRFDTGKTARNLVEARAVAAAVIQHAANRPDQTLGVGAMSVSQRDAILDEVERLRRENPASEAFFSLRPDEPFFVKNLENIQGDERDVIYISIGYGPSVGENRVYQRFGPLAGDGGHRRLNVLISRARQRCEVFSSLTHDHIHVGPTTKRGVIALKTFLRFAETGQIGIAMPSGRAPDSAFEADVRNVLVQRGLQVECQVGVAGFFIDLAVMDPERPGSYILGIECDGAAYHSSQSARDRDRLRQSILEAQGWTLHRIWSTDWFQRRDDQISRLVSAVEAARVMASASAQSAARIATAPQVEARPIPREAAPLLGDEAVLAPLPYQKAAFSVSTSQGIHEISAPRLASILRQIIDIEGPVHEQELITRTRELWGLGRAGGRIQAAVHEALHLLRKADNYDVEGDCFIAKGARIAVRDRSKAESTTLKKPELLPPQEVRAAVLKVLNESHGMAADEIPIAVSRLLGFAATSAQLRSVIERQVAELQRRGELQNNGELLQLA